LFKYLIEAYHNQSTTEWNGKGQRKPIQKHI